jgi:ABC-type phosphate transport system permease subunit
VRPRLFTVVSLLSFLLYVSIVVEWVRTSSAAYMTWIGHWGILRSHGVVFVFGPHGTAMYFWELALAFMVLPIIWAATRCWLTYVRQPVTGRCLACGYDRQHQRRVS